MTVDDETLLLINAYADGELSPGETIEMERRLVADPALRALVDQIGHLSVALRDSLPRVAIPEALRGRVLQEIGLGEPPPRRWNWSSWQALAASLILGLGLGGVLGSSAVYLKTARSIPETGEAVLAGHLRSLVAPQPFDVASSDRHVVKPWFNGRTTIAPSAPDLADKGFPLVGGRIDVVAGKTVPTLVYRHDRHVISVTIVPKTSDASPGERNQDGSTLESWSAGDLTYWAVSDLNPHDLRGFVDFFRGRIAQES